VILEILTDEQKKQLERDLEAILDSKEDADKVIRLLKAWSIL
jgi:hypothetical protein